nr:putative ribonuclease H-like domain-containing protein [Tanacetum cinerariifolium]
MQQVKNKPQNRCSPEVPEGNGNTNPTASTPNPPTEQMETLTVETPIPTVSSPVPTACLNDSPEPSKPKKAFDVLQGPSWVEAMQEELLQFKIQNVWTLVDCPKGPDIMFAVCACARYQVTPKECHLHAVKKIFRYLKGHPKMGLWYPKASPFDLVAYSDSDYGGASQDRKSTTGGSQF